MRYTLVTDDDDHWYVIPIQHLSAWHSWVETCEEKGWPEPPAWAHAVGGSPGRVTFTDWRIG